jgi:predicted alpha/beta-fold hydrolase
MLHSATPAADSVATAASFRPPRWLRGPHRQTLFPFLFMRPSIPPRQPERLELPDGDFVDLCHFGGGDGPRVCLFHGLEGSLASHYIGGLAQALLDLGCRVTFMHFRGCSGEPNRLPRAYHSGDTGDIGYLIATLRTREPDTPLAAAGFSLGGNALAKYLGEQADQTPLSAAVAVSVPFDLSACADYIDRGFSRVYQAHLVRSMRASTRARIQRVGELPIDMEALERARSFREFDDAVTAPLHGFADAPDYYRRASSGPWLRSIMVPTRLIQACDDPFVGPDPVPTGDDVAHAVELDISPHGGHCGFVAATRRGRPYRWLDNEIARWLHGHIA